MDLTFQSDSIFNLRLVSWCGKEQWSRVCFNHVHTKARVMFKQTGSMDVYVCMYIHI